MKKITTFFTAASGTFAVVPGLAVLLSHVGVPPGSSTALFSGALESLGILTLMLCWMDKARIARMSIRAVGKRAIAGMILFVICLFLYIYLFGDLVRDVPHSEPVFFPIWPEGELKILLQKIPGRDNLVEELGRDDVVKIIQSSSKNALLITTLALLALYQLIFIPLIISFGLVAIKGMDRDSMNKP